MDPIIIRGRTYQVEKRGDVYWLTGVRGARYFTMRNKPNPALMFVLPGQWTKSNVLDRVWLTDKAGALVVVR